MVQEKKQLRRPGRTGGARDTNRKERVKALSDVALRLFLERGIDGVTIDEITQATGVAKGTFYRYFADKGALVQALLAPIRQDAIDALETCAKALQKARDVESMFEAYRAVGAVLAGMLLTHSGVVRLYLQESRGPARGARVHIVELAGQIAKLAIRVTEQAHTHGLLKPIHPAVSALGVVGAVERLLLGVLREEDVGNPLEIPDALSTMVLDGLRKQPDPS